MDIQGAFPAQTVLVVDDTPGNIDVLSGALRSSYRVKAALNGERALAIASSDPMPDIILLDVMMPDMDGYEVLRRLRANPMTAPIPVIFVTALSDESDEYKGLELGAVDYIAKPITPSIVRARVRTHLALHQQNRELERKVQERTEELQRTRLEIIRRLGRAAEFRDNETGLHVIRMSHYSRLLVEAVSSSSDWADLVFNAAPMHDVGKIGIPDQILLKPGPLSPAEWEIMRTHPVIGGQIIGDDPSHLMRLSRVIAENHHERWDGQGYPHGLRGNDIPQAARIVALADVLDALTTERPYKKAWPLERAVDHIRQMRGIHFDPLLVDVLTDLLPEVLKIMRLYQDHPAPFRPHELL
ncbi:MAG: response regulator [Magnetospirillum sp.]|nr:response regulator [Magnetospirillum sp.]